MEKLAAKLGREPTATELREYKEKKAAKKAAKLTDAAPAAGNDVQPLILEVRRRMVRRVRKMTRRRATSRLLHLVCQWSGRIARAVHE